MKNTQHETPAFRLKKRNLPVYIVNDGVRLMMSSRFPIKNWLDVCHKRPFIAISYRPDYREEDCPRPWKIRLHTSWFSDLGTRCKTLKNAEKKAIEWSREFARAAH